MYLLTASRKISDLPAEHTGYCLCCIGTTFDFIFYFVQTNIYYYCAKQHENLFFLLLSFHSSFSIVFHALLYRLSRSFSFIIIRNPIWFLLCCLSSSSIFLLHTELRNEFGFCTFFRIFSVLLIKCTREMSLDIQLKIPPIYFYGPLNFEEVFYCNL